MPVIAVGAAIFAGATIATVGVAAMSTMAVISAVGAIASGIGVITGNKELTKIGGIVSLAGGVGALAQSQGWIGTELAKGATEGVAGAAGAAKAAVPGAIDPSAAVAQNVAQAGAGAATDVAGAATGAAGAGADLGAAASSTAFDSALKTAGAATSTPGQSALTMLGSVGDWMEKNKNVAGMLTNFVGGALDREKDAKVKQSEAIADLYATRNQTERQQAANGSAVPDLTGLKVNKNANVYGKTTTPTYSAPKARSLINA